MAERSTSPETTLQIRSTCAEPRQKVYDPRTERQKQTLWICRLTEQESTKVPELDLRHRGRYRLQVPPPEAHHMLLSRTYLEVKSTDRMGLTWQSEGDPDFG